MKRSDKFIRKCWRELKSVPAVARRIGYTRQGAYKAIRRLGYKVA